MTLNTLVLSIWFSRFPGTRGQSFWLRHNSNMMWFFPAIGGGGVGIRFNQIEMHFLAFQSFSTVPLTYTNFRMDKFYKLNNKYFLDANHRHHCICRFNCIIANKESMCRKFWAQLVNSFDISPKTSSSWSTDEHSPVLYPLQRKCKQLFLTPNLINCF